MNVIDIALGIILGGVGLVVALFLLQILFLVVVSYFEHRERQSGRKKW